MQSQRDPEVRVASKEGWGKIIKPQATRFKTRLFLTFKFVMQVLRSTKQKKQKQRNTHTLSVNNTSRVKHLAEQ